MTGPWLRRPRRGFHTARAAAGRALFGSALYRHAPRLSLGTGARSLAASAADPWPGDAAKGEGILQGDFRCAGRTRRLERNLGGPSDGSRGGVANWTPTDEPARSAWLHRLHSFAWLDDVRAVGTDAARKTARADIVAWLSARRRLPVIAFAADVSGQRLAAWLTHYDFLCSGADEMFRRRFYSGLAWEARHLARALTFTPPGSGRLVALKGMVYGALCLTHRRGQLESCLRRLDHELERQVLADGGHIGRNPSVLLRLLRDFIDIRAVLIGARQEVPPRLQNAIDRMAPMLRFFRHGDGGLALFNGSREEAGWLIDMTLARADAPGKPFAYAPHSGFQRLTANRSVLLLDAGAAAADAWAHAGTLSFEMSVGKERLIVNCGAPGGDEQRWRDALRATSAHSTLTVADTNSLKLLDGGGMAGRPVEVSCRRNEAEDGIWIEACQTGYVANFGLLHRRRLWLSAGGDDLRGEDSLEPVGETPVGDQKFAVRFHLHPRVRASLVENGAGALLRLPSGSGWRLRAAGGSLSVSESIYFGAQESGQRCAQLVLEGSTHAGAAQIKWALQRVGAPH